MKRFAGVPLVWLCSTLAWADAACVQGYLAAEKDQVVKYRASYQGLGAEVTRQISEPEAGVWQLEQALSMLLVGLNEESRFRVTDSGIESISYRYEQTGLGARSYQIRLDDQGGRFIVDRNDQSTSYDSVPGAVDRLSHLLQLQIERECGDPERSEITLKLANRKGLREYRYERQESDPLELQGLGSVEVELWQRSDGDTLDQAWLAPELNYRLIRFRHREDGEKSELLIQPD